ncbi:MAG TPA: hypothetical protein VEL47_01770, partial [Myxococcota bacterium]|nr:hypothetical protein [Myxococcota bacterium]
IKKPGNAANLEDRERLLVEAHGERNYHTWEISTPRKLSRYMYHESDQQIADDKEDFEYAIDELERQIPGEVDESVMNSELNTTFREYYCIPEFWGPRGFERLAQIAEIYNIQLTFRLSHLPLALKRALGNPEIMAYVGCVVMVSLVGGIIIVVTGLPKSDADDDAVVTTSRTVGRVIGCFLMSLPLAVCGVRAFTLGCCCFRDGVYQCINYIKKCLSPTHTVNSEPPATSENLETNFPIREI